jgi:hypothetical protein
VPNSSSVATALDALGTDEEKQRLIGQWFDAQRIDANTLPARAFWEHVAHCNGLAVGRWKFVADPHAVRNILENAHGLFTVREYNRRMHATSGRFYLGMDGTEHEGDAQYGAIIPSWNAPLSTPAVQAPAVLEQVRQVAETASRHVLAALGRRTRLARLSDQDAHCRLTIGELLGAVLDACVTKFFGVPGPSELSLIRWAEDVTWYHFRIQANETEDRSAALQASAQYRGHVLSLIAQLDEEPRPEGAAATPDSQRAREAIAAQKNTLRKHVTAIRTRMQGDNTQATISDDDVARNLIGIMTGSLSATAKAFGEAVAVQVTGDDGRIRWPRTSAAQPSVPSQTTRELRAFPLYDAIIAGPLRNARRGSLDAIYRVYRGDTAYTEGSLTIQQEDLVIVWIGSTLEAEPNNLFGIGPHKCPGMDMAKAILEGTLYALTSLPDEAGVTRERIDGDLYLAFEDPARLEAL